LQYDEVRSAFTQKLGANEDRQRHHVLYYLERDGSDCLVGKISHSRHGQASNDEILWWAKKLHLVMAEFRQFVDCQLSADAMIQLWQDREAQNA
jgi:hypothetical protein